ncbi:MAG TPA: isoprenylcysteine carboxylmethyltransferase family protein [Candidatus Saccharimonadales bacterium]|nr:isoprenylcysteine carboxylmethyltransferase family protein [Candidatus Saccharimonadales bacterium]
MALIQNLIVWIWLVFWIYWMVSAFGSKRNISRGINSFAGVRLAVFVLLLIFLRFSVSPAHFLKNNQVASQDQSLVVLGFFLFLLGLALAVWARIYLGKNWGMPMSKKQNPELVTAGPYSFIRHPIYTGILSAVLGTAFASSFYWLILLVILGTYFIYSATIEEKIMLNEFPKTYPAYKNKTKMLIPFIF